jgi:hypothetical protein
VDHFKAVITEPNRPAPKIDEYGVLVIPPAGIYYGVSLVNALDWARKTLPRLTDGAYCTFYRIDEVEVEKMTKEEVVSAPTNTSGTQGI